MSLPKKSKIITVVGARPQFIKAAMLSKELFRKGYITERIIHTGQHYDTNMSDIFFRELELPEPDYNLGIHRKSHGAMTGEILIKLEKVLVKEAPDLVLVYGDTDSTLAGALAAAKLHIPVAHVEAGLRSFNRSMPEEINRVITDHISDLLFAPTVTATNHLKNENLPDTAIHLSGDIMFDAALHASQSENNTNLLMSLSIDVKKYILATLHRAENTDSPERLLTWMEGLNEAAKLEPVLMPLHPRTRKRMHEIGKTASDYSNIRFIDPVGYVTMAALTKNARLVVTDSGGLQKEAYFHRVPGLILRDETEWIELLDVRWSRLIGCDKDELVDAIRSSPSPSSWMADLFGSGKTAQFIAAELKAYLT